MADPLSCTSSPTRCCAVILAGGRNTRMGGRNKALLKLGGKTILDRLSEALEGLFDEILLVTRDAAAYRGRPLRVVGDILAARSSLTGIHAGLYHCKAPYALIVAGDTPFLQRPLIKMLLNEIEPQFDMIIPAGDGRLQPLCAIYAKRCLLPIEAQIKRKDYKITNLFEELQIKTLPPAKLREADPALYSFINVNTPAAFEACRNLLPLLNK